MNYREILGSLWITGNDLGNLSTCGYCMAMHWFAKHSESIQQWRNFFGDDKLAYLTKPVWDQMQRNFWRERNIGSYTFQHYTQKNTGIRTYSAEKRRNWDFSLQKFSRGPILCEEWFGRTVFPYKNFLLTFARVGKSKCSQESKKSRNFFDSFCLFWVFMSQILYKNQKSGRILDKMTQ